MHSHILIQRLMGLGVTFVLAIAVLPGCMQRPPKYTYTPPARQVTIITPRDNDDEYYMAPDADDDGGYILLLDPYAPK
jgi:hypothetical protein